MVRILNYFDVKLTLSVLLIESNLDVSGRN